MQYKCENCRRRFEFDDFIEFCPYCGSPVETEEMEYAHLEYHQASCDFGSMQS